ncbi:tRNA glutamyl-Q(34) synthetase GluQRS [Mesorhizobium xinjiangense]|uniref:tRNA glutamyl-Q(34) synthetase GluQRS n=1 Tax=Mesorhizobium xinjiangense TaxID=2678685 RepID=UPI0012EDA1AB|nr:tRNA glutamyl-Q(34) synthetase GluQRS [Mesorhizobium xinjiangense]
MTRPIFRFAPSPNGRLHLGHAYSALVNQDLAEAVDGRMLLRIEDIDTARCLPEFERGLMEDLAWLGLAWEEPVRRQSDHFDDYRAALERLIAEDIIYPAFMSRSEMRAHVAESESAGMPWPRDPDGAPLYPDIDRNLPALQRKARMEAGEPFSWRLDMQAALAAVSGRALDWQELGSGPDGETGCIEADPARWGDIVLARKDTPASYALCVTVDDAIQGVTHVVRGRDLFHATSVQRLLQELIGLPAPVYTHHDLIVGPDGRKLSKSAGDTALAALRAAGMTPRDIRRMVGLG